MTVFLGQLEPDWQDLIPETTLREQQLDVLHRLWPILSAGETFAMVEAPTGVGKSVIILALMRYVASMGKSSFMATPQRALQDQMAAWHDVAVMKGRGSYECYVTDGTARDAPCVDGGVEFRNRRDECSVGQCPFFTSLAAAQMSPCVVHNYASLLAQVHLANSFEPRALLCLDEAHTASEWIRGYYTIEVSDRLCDHMGNGRPNDLSWFVPWLAAVASSSATPSGPDKKDAEFLIRKISMNQMAHGMLSEAELKQRLDDSGLKMSVKEFALANLRMFKPGVEWEVVEDRFGRYSGVKAIPLRTAPLARTLTGLGEVCICFTATVLDPLLLAAELGLSDKKGNYVATDSAFPSANRPIIKAYVGKINFKNEAAMMPQVITQIATIAKRHRGQRGIIHVTSHRASKEIGEALDGRVDRPVHILPQGSMRDDIIAGFLDGRLGMDAILVGPGLMEGVDGAGDSCRWQVMAKVPWPNRQDPVARFLMDSPDQRRRDQGARWYTWKTAQKFVQGVGRVCRGPEDHGITYLVDEGFETILSYKNVPTYVKRAIRSST